MDKSRFDELLRKYQNGELTPEEKTRLDAWMDSLGDDDQEMEMTVDEQQQLFNKIKQSIGDSEQSYKLRPKQRQIVNRGVWIKIAATILLLISVSFYLWTTFQPKTEARESSALNEVKKMILNDGTIVWLKGQSKLIYFEVNDQNERRANLEGEALFEVAKDPNRPFIIKCGDLSAKVLGTSFNLKSEKNHLELMVFTGKVNLSSLQDTKGIMVTPNQKVVYAGTGPINKISINETEVQGLLANTDYNMRFTNSTMSEIFKRIERKFDVKVDPENPQIAGCLITADFTDQSLDNTLKMISEVLDFKYSINDHTVTIRGTGCR